MIDRICSLEARVDPRQSSPTIDEIRDAATNHTHMYVCPNSILGIRTDCSPSVPHYHVISKRLEAGKLSNVVNWIRGFLIEDVYRPLGKWYVTTHGPVLTNAKQ